jgi:hypothetical protein
VVEAGVGQIEAERVFPVDAGSDALGGLAVGKALRLLEIVTRASRDGGQPGLPRTP